MKHSTESVASSYVKAGDLVRSRQRHGQWVERAGVRDALVWPVPVVERSAAGPHVQALEYVPREPVQQCRQQRPVSRGEPRPVRAELPLQDQELV
jgi:hypothetical protein